MPPPCAPLVAFPGWADRPCRLGAVGFTGKSMFRPRLVSNARGYVGSQSDVLSASWCHADG
eukprot:6248680-Pyramimonas_sp.AAC.1